MPNAASPQLAPPGREPRPGPARDQALPPGGRPAQPAGDPLPGVVAGHPSHEEVAALMVALSAVLAASRRSAQRQERAAAVWADRSRLLKVPPAPGPDAWRRSARP